MAITFLTNEDGQGFDDRLKALEESQGSGESGELSAGLKNALTAFFTNIKVYVPQVMVNTTEDSGPAVVASAQAVLDALSGDSGSDQPTGSGGVTDNGRILTITGDVSATEDGNVLRFT